MYILILDAFSVDAISAGINATALYQNDVNDDVEWNGGVSRILFFVAFAVFAALFSQLMTIIVRWCMKKFELGGMKKSKLATSFESSNLNLPMRKRSSQSHMELFQISSVIPLEGNFDSCHQSQAKQKNSPTSCVTSFSIHEASQEQQNLTNQKKYSNDNKV